MAQPVKVWDDINKRWLTPVSITFNEDATAPILIVAVDPGQQPLSDGWHNISGDALDHVAVSGAINHNENIFPK